jgi:tetratricopeptide (TPR) repeat protein
LYFLEKYQEAILFYEKAIANEPKGEHFYHLACGYAKIGDRNKALENLKKAIDNKYGSKTQFIAEPAFKALKSKVRFKRLLRIFSN